MGSISTMYIDIHFVKKHSPRAYPPKLVNLTSAKVRVPPMVGRRYAAAGGERRCWAPRAGPCLFSHTDKGSSLSLSLSRSLSLSLSPLPPSFPPSVLLKSCCLALPLAFGVTAWPALGAVAPP